jgi:hypothetical protein
MENFTFSRVNDYSAPDPFDSIDAGESWVCGEFLILLQKDPAMHGFKCNKKRECFYETTAPILAQKSIDCLRQEMLEEFKANQAKSIAQKTHEINEFNRYFKSQPANFLYSASVFYPSNKLPLNRNEKPIFSACILNLNLSVINDYFSYIKKSTVPLDGWADDQLYITLFGHQAVPWNLYQHVLDESLDAIRNRLFKIIAKNLRIKGQARFIGSINDVLN